MACAHCAGVERNQADDEFIHLPKRVGQQRTPAYRAVNPMGLVPALALDDGTVLTQSIASMEYLDETHPEPPLLPEDPETRARVRAFALSIACEVHSARCVAPSLDHGGTEHARNHRAEHRFRAVPVRCCAGHGRRLPGAANSERARRQMSRGCLPMLRVEAAALALPAFRHIAPDRQPDVG